MKKISACFLLSFLITACTGGNAVHYLQSRDLPAPTIDNFTHCYGYGCDKRVSASLPDETQRKLGMLFTPKATSASQERQKIAEAIGMLETDIGALTGTDKDKHGTFRIFEGNNSQYDHRYQQDCIDESTNTTTYLVLLDKMGLLVFHTPAFPANRQPFITGNNWWHQTAVIKETQTKERYVVDSWFHDNGTKAEIVGLSQWKKGWSPDKNEQTK